MSEFNRYRIDRIELAFGFFQVSMDDTDDLSMLRQLAPDTTEASLRSWRRCSTDR